MISGVEDKLNQKHMYFENPKTLQEIIIKATAIHFGLDVKEFTESTATDQSASYQRFICIYLIRQKTLLSYPLIAELFNRKQSAAKNAFYQISGLEAIKDRRTIDDLKEIKLIIDSFTDQKKQQYA